MQCDVDKSPAISDHMFEVMSTCHAVGGAQPGLRSGLYRTRCNWRRIRPGWGEPRYVPRKRARRKEWDMKTISTGLKSPGFLNHQQYRPIGSMYGIFTYIYPKNQPNVGKYTVHRSYFLLALPFLLGQSTGTVNSHIMAGQPTPQKQPALYKGQLLTTWFSL